MATKKFLKFDLETNQLACFGDWTITNLSEIKYSLEKIEWPTSGKITITGDSISRMDSAGSWILTQWIEKLSGKKIKIHLENFTEKYKKLLAFSEEQKSFEDIPVEKKLNWIQQLGKYSLQQASESFKFINFLGKLVFESFRILRSPNQLRLNTIFSVINQSGTSAVAIVALLSFMIGVVITYQMGNQLRNYGANLFIVNLVGYSILREFGPLLTGIIISGRTGSAFTAQLGLMKMNKEIDALNLMGITPDIILVIPRLIALIIVVPLLTIWADIFGVLGGMLMSQYLLNISWSEFILRFQNEIPLRALLIGLGKAPVFALIIATVGCFQGMEVRGTAESVGMRTTRSVVISLFFIVIFDGIISILLSMYQL